MSGPAPRGPAPGATALALAARALAQVTDDGCTAELALARLDVPEKERAAVRAILSGTLRWYLRLAPAVDVLLQRGQSMHGLVRAVLVAGSSAPSMPAVDQIIGPTTRRRR
jgi:hypothetical protein